MPVINLIDCKCERFIRFFLFALLIFSESSTTGNFIIFKDLNIVQMGLDKKDSQWQDSLTL